MDNEISERVRRIYAAIEHVIEPGVTEVPVRTARVGTMMFMEVDFRENLTRAELANRVHAVICNVAHLKDHLLRWCRARKLAADLVTNVVTKSLDLKIKIDLCNNDKHSYPPRNGGESKLSPRITEIDRWMKMTTTDQAGSTVGFTIGPDGRGRVLGDGSASIFVTGSVVDGAGEPLGDLAEIVQGAVTAWETFLAEARAAL